jgi:hypothetical protein
LEGRFVGNWVEEARKRPGAVFVGKVIEVAEHPSQLFAQYRFQVEKSWTPGLPEEVVVSTSRWSGGCGSSFEDGVSYLIYSYGSSPTQLSTNICQRNKPYADKLADLAALGPTSPLAPVVDRVTIQDPEDDHPFFHEVATRISLSGGSSPKFSFTGSGEMVDLTIYGPRQRAGDGAGAYIVWKLAPIDAAATLALLNGTGTIDFGVIPKGYKQVYPVNNIPPVPLQEGQEYLLQVMTNSAPSGQISFEIRAGKPVEVSVK